MCLHDTDDRAFFILLPRRDMIERHLNNFVTIFNQICELDQDSVQYKYDSLSSWWQEIREILLESPSVFKSLLAAMMCRDIAIQYRQAEVTIQCVYDLSFQMSIMSTTFFRIMIPMAKKSHGKRFHRKTHNGHS